jgi:hypothetical protein
MKSKVLIIFKYFHHWNSYVTEKFSNYYDTESIYISDFKNRNYTEIINDINNLIKLTNIEIVVFDVDYFKFINFFFIEKIKCKKKVIMIGDDASLHEFHSITANACDLVLNSDPLAVLKYKEKGYEAKFFQFEFSRIGDNKVGKKEIDVLFYGNVTPDRKIFLDFIEKEGISLKIVGHNNIDTSSYLPKDELLDLISKSKVVLNFSKTRTTVVQNYTSEGIYKFYYEFKGKVIVAGLKGTVCVSEYSPGQELLFSEDEVPTFFTKEECVNILKKLLNNEELLKKYESKFTTKVCNLYEEKKSFEAIYNAIQKSNHRRVELIKIPYWYLRIAAKQILLRNLKLSSLMKAIFQFSIIFKIIKNLSFLTKLLVVFESVINTLWYSLAFTLKSKK